MNRSRGVRSTAVTLVRVGVVVACGAAAVAGLGETHAVAQSAGGSGGSASPPPPDGGSNGGGNGFTFADDFETSGTWAFYSSSTTGIGYVSSRPADALSPTHVGDEYDQRGAAPGYQMLGRPFTLPANTGPCGVTVHIKPLTAVTGELQILDAANKHLLMATPFNFPGAGSWQAVSAVAHIAASANVISIRVVLDHNGTWQEFLVDDLIGNCALNR